MAERFQRQRTLGYHLPPGVVCVTRPGVFGNPFTLANCRESGHNGTDREIAQRCVEAYRIWLGPYWRDIWQAEESQQRRTELLRRLPELRGKSLACWCRLDQPCHADVLLEFANREVK